MRQTQTKQPKAAMPSGKKWGESEFTLKYKEPDEMVHVFNCITAAEAFQEIFASRPEVPHLEFYALFFVYNKMVSWLSCTTCIDERGYLDSDLLEVAIKALNYPDYYLAARPAPGYSTIFKEDFGRTQLHYNDLLTELLPVKDLLYVMPQHYFSLTQMGIFNPNPKKRA